MGWDENIEDLTDETSNAIMPSEIRKAQQDKSKANLHLPHYLILMDSIEARFRFGLDFQIWHSSERAKSR